MRRRAMSIIVCVFATLCGQTVPAEARGVGTSSQAADRKAQLEEFAKDAAVYEVTLEGPQPTPLKLLTPPILNWDGSAFVWLKDGRPEAIGALWANLNPRTGKVDHGHAFQSLSDQPITARFRSQVVWSPKTPGLQFQVAQGAD